MKRLRTGRILCVKVAVVAACTLAGMNVWSNGDSLRGNSSSNSSKSSTDIADFMTTVSSALLTLLTNVSSNASSYSPFLSRASQNNEESYRQKMRFALRQKSDIRVGVLLPFTGNRPFAIKKVAPAIEKAVDEVAFYMGPWNFGR